MNAGSEQKGGEQSNSSNSRTSTNVLDETRSDQDFNCSFQVKLLTTFIWNHDTPYIQAKKDLISDTISRCIFL